MYFNNLDKYILLRIRILAKTVIILVSALLTNSSFSNSDNLTTPDVDE